MDLQARAFALVEESLRAALPSPSSPLSPLWPNLPLAHLLPTPQDFDRLLDQLAPRLEAILYAPIEPSSRPPLRGLLESCGIRKGDGNTAVQIVWYLFQTLGDGTRISAPAAAPPSRPEAVDPSAALPSPRQTAIPPAAPAPPPAPPASSAPVPSTAPPRSGRDVAARRIDRVRFTPPPEITEEPVPNQGSATPDPNLTRVGEWHGGAQSVQDLLKSLPNASVVRVFFATDRLQIPTFNGKAQFDQQRSTLGELHFGHCDVSIPKSHRTGKLESPSILRLEFRPDPAKHIVLVDTQTIEEELFFDQLASVVNASPRKDAFVFVHGYNVSFETAARRTGQIAFDLQFAGAPIFYSWPSNGHIADYMKDETNISWSAPHLERFLHLLSYRLGAQRIHLIAHSMGNRAVCEALKNLSRDPSSQLRLTHLVLAAPDIDAGTFAELAATLQRISTRVTLYESSKDRAIQASKKLHGNPRAGEPLLVIPGLDTIDASAIDTDFLGHSYFSDNWPLLSDLHALIGGDESPATRFGLSALQHAAGTYYVFRP